MPAYDVADHGSFSKDPEDGDRSEPAPDAIRVLQTPVRTLPGVGPKLAARLTRLTGRSDGRPARRLDLLFHLPHALVDRTLTDDPGAVDDGGRVTVEVRVLAHEPPARPRLPYKVRCWTTGGFLHLVFFRARVAYLEEILPEGARRVVSGPLTRFGPERQIVHPEMIATRAELEARGRLEPVYPLVQGLTQRAVFRAVTAALDDLPAPAEWQDRAWLVRQGWPGFADALRDAHRPSAAADIEPGSPARRRLAYDELLANQLALMLVRGGGRRGTGRSLCGDGRLRKAVLSPLPFRLTAGQRKVLAEIDADMARPARMLRLLQGDVGSGKTLVALLAMLNAVEAGAQAVLMAPTDLLARQHAATLEKLLTPTGLHPVLVTGRGQGRGRARALDLLARGEARIAVGTHALFQSEVAFADLGLAVIDEQHRFGVQQRMDLLAKSRAGDVLVMTATPIPRTMVLSLYGDMAVSELRGRPPGRQPVRTRVLPLARLDELTGRLARLLENGERLYWVCPLIEADETGGTATAVARAEALRTRFGNAVGLAHGRMPARERDANMAAFAAGRKQILVATTVIEVGVDVPAASVIAIEHAERFGLAQLHQLRGRVGRGDRAATCLLLYAEPLAATARRRLDVMRATDDGFRIAAADLELRGPGELLGIRQSGAPSFRLVDLGAHGDLLQAAHDDARQVLTRDSSLNSPRGRSLRGLLRLFERDEAAAYLRSG